MESDTMRSNLNLEPWQWFQSLHSDMQMQLVLLVVGTIVVLTAIICVLINSIHRCRAELQLKRELLERGMTADEIATVVHTKPRSSPRREKS
jgi:hypothetical protein